MKHAESPNSGINVVYTNSDGAGMLLTAFQLIERQAAYRDVEIEFVDVEKVGTGVRFSIEINGGEAV